MSTLTVGQLEKIIGILKNIPSEKIQKFLSSGLLTDILNSPDISRINRNDFETLCRLGSLRQICKDALRSYDVIVDYDMSFGDMVEAGKYNWTNGIVSQKFFIGGKVNIRIKLINPSHYAEFDRLVRFFNWKGFRPVKIEELLAFGAKFPDFQREFPIAGLGSVFSSKDGWRGCPFLGGSLSDRFLRVNNAHQSRKLEFNGNFRFAVVRNR